MHLAVVAVLALLLLGGRGRISSLMGDAAQGIKAFKKGMQDDPNDKAAHDPHVPRRDAEGVDLRG